MVECEPRPSLITTSEHDEAAVLTGEKR